MTLVDDGCKRVIVSAEAPAALFILRVIAQALGSTIFKLPDPQETLSALKMET